jgi:predicted O-linked N-acetylglucosamine transferase (SPINDLY family)
MFDESIDTLRQAAAARPTDPTPHLGLGDTMLARGDFKSAIEAYRHVVDQVQPFSPRATVGLADAHIALDNVAAAEATYKAYFERVRGKKPDPLVIDRCAAFMASINRLEAGATMLRSGSKAWPEIPLLSLRYAHMLNYWDRAEPQEILDAHLATAVSSIRVLQPKQLPLLNNADTDKRLRIGYLSPSLYAHAVAFFVMNLFKHHDRSKVEVFAYAQFVDRKPDMVSDMLRASVDRWTDVSTLATKALVDQIVTDQIDILVDLGGLEPGSRLDAVMFKPAPIVLTYCGYPNVTCLPQIDARIGDALTDPADAPALPRPPADVPGAPRAEPVLRLPGCFLNYTALPTNEPASPLPALKNGYVTFGSFNNFLKVSPTTARAWAAVLQAVPNARMIVKGHAFTREGSRTRAAAYLAQHGVDISRVEIRPRTQDMGQHLGTYNEVDIALDSFPYNGTTTTCEAMFMGCPVVSLSGRAHASRVGLSLLTAVGMPELAVSSQEQYVAQAQQLSSDLPALASLRAGLRDRLINSPLCDGKNFANKLENAYRNLWRQWCETGSVNVS